MDNTALSKPSTEGTAKLVYILPDYHRDSASFNRRCGIGAVRQPILTSSIIIDSRLNR